MRKLRAVLALLFVLIASSAFAQMTVPHTFSAGQLIDATKFNANFDEIETKALNRTGGTITGNITVNGGVTIDGIDLSAVLGGTGSPTFATIATSGLASLNSLSVATTAAITGNTTIGGTFGVTGAATLTSTLAVNSTSAAAIDVAGGITAGSGNVAVIGTDGRIPSINSTTFASLDGSNLTSLVASQLTGALPAINATNLTALNATALTTGTVADARLSSNIPRDNSSEQITQTWEMSNVIPRADNTYTLGDVGVEWLRVLVAEGSPASPSVKVGNFESGLYSDGGFELKFAVIGGAHSTMGKENVGLGNRLHYTIPSTVNGTGAATGNYIHIGNNISGAAGFLIFRTAGGGIVNMWSDASNIIRVANNAPPEQDGTPSDTSGVVVGSQVSQRALKNIYSEFTDNAAALATILQTPVWDFDYKNGAYNGQQFVGITTDDSPVFGMDQGRSFNPVTAFGYTVAAVKELDRRIRELEAEIAELKGASQP